MAMPSGEIVGRPMVARACGCMKEFQVYAVDKYREQRLTKFKKTRCEDCVAKLNEEQRQAAAAKPGKGEAFGGLPAGAVMAITKLPDGNWSGEVVADGTKVTATGGGPHGLTLALAREWVMARGSGAAPPPPKPAAAPPPKPAPPAPRAAPPRKPV